MGYRNLTECIEDLEHSGHLKRLEVEVDPNLEIGAIQRRVYQAGGPALLFTRVKGSSFPMLGNLFGTLERTRFLFRDTLEAVKAFIDLKVDPQEVLKKPIRLLKVPKVGLSLYPRKTHRGPIIERETTLSQLPALKSWPKDGGPFITLPQVYTEDPDRPGVRFSNLGMYRVQLSGNRYAPDREIGLHYQIHRGIGVHHTAALRRKEPLRVNIFVGGTPAMTLAAVMPLPEGLPELFFAGALAGHRIPMVQRRGELPIYGEADFCITGTIDPERLLPEGPFGDHLGYYSLQHDYPVLKVDHVYHRPNAIWPFTTVGRPPQEDTNFGAFIHELTGPVIPTVIPGVKEVNAVDATGVHPLLLAIGSERYTPYAQKDRPQELLTQANAILGQGQLSLAKYLWIINGADAPQLNLHAIDDFFRHALERVDWTRDLHFQTKTTIDTLDYSGSGLNEGSKVVVAVSGAKKRDLPAFVPAGLNLPEGFQNPRLCLPGILVIHGPRQAARVEGEDPRIVQFCQSFHESDSINRFPLVVIADDSEFTARTLNNFLWITFTRSNPAADIYGIGSFMDQKHWGCRGSLVIDARIKPHHAPPLEDDPEIEKRVDALGQEGGPLHGII